MSQASLEVRGLSKRFGERVALDALSFAVRPGRFVALLGPNGAGKSTLFQILTGLFHADEGEVLVAGESLRQKPARVLAGLGVVFQSMSLDLDLSVERNLLFHADLHGMPRALAHARIDAGCAALGLTGDKARVVRDLSGGTRRKVELVRALLHQPALLLMDEATVGLDPQSRRDLLGALRHDVSTRSSSVLWATHWVEEAASADEVLVLHQGRLLAQGAPNDVAQVLGGGGLEEAFIRATAARSAALN